MTLANPTVRQPPPALGPAGESAAHDLQAHCRAGERLTRQRRAVWRVCAGSPDHLTVEAILAALMGEFPRLSTGTVYRDLCWLKERGLICETDVGHGAKVYEVISDPPHHHLICLRCGAVDNLDDAYLDALRQATERDRGFAARLDHLAVFGLCGQCRPQ
jgi:Fur family transcriptional regulator, ferric uptake regulator